MQSTGKPQVHPSRSSAAAGANKLGSLYTPACPPRHSQPTSLGRQLIQLARGHAGVDALHHLHRDRHGVDEPGVQPAAQLADAGGDLVEMHLLLAAIALDDKHLEGRWGGGGKACPTPYSVAALGEGGARLWGETQSCVFCMSGSSYCGLQRWIAKLATQQLRASNLVGSQ